jgi:hypothetical protein
LAASRSHAGIAQPPPKGDGWAKPTSSSTSSTMFGAPSRAWGTAGQAGSESRSVRPIRPANADPPDPSLEMLIAALLVPTTRKVLTHSVPNF